MRLLRAKDHGWYVSIFSNKHSHPLSASRQETRHWNSHSEINLVRLNFIKNLR
uniref:FAR1 domain-containing protein n=1 Tax=Aegilops tauschii subsp. strangulata TaxID=200361 RepID=A0A453CXC2_AEGTS